MPTVKQRDTVAPIKLVRKANRFSTDQRQSNSRESVASIQSVRHVILQITRVTFSTIQTNKCSSSGISSTGRRLAKKLGRMATWRWYPPFGASVVEKVSGNTSIASTLHNSRKNPCMRSEVATGAEVLWIKTAHEHVMSATNALRSQSYCFAIEVGT